MSARVQLDGMDAFRQALRNLPEHLTAVASDIVQARAERTKQDVQTSYPTGATGNLERMVSVSRFNRGKVSAAAIVRSRAPHASIYEYGTKRRETAKGHNRGVSPAHHVLVPIAIRQRQAMTAELIALLRDQGFEVGGFAPTAGSRFTDQQ